jgi:hypothetical protein
LRLKPPVPPVRLHTGMGADKSDEALESADEPTLQQPPLSVEPAPVRVKEPVRRSAIEDKLRQLDRLPPNHRYLSVAILKSIVLMYEEIKKHRGRAARAHCVRSCFANEAHLRAGLLALLELLDPSSSSLLVESASEELIDALLMQERAIWQRARARRTPPNVLNNAPSRRGPGVPPRMNPGLPPGSEVLSNEHVEQGAGDADTITQSDPKYGAIRPSLPSPPGPPDPSKPTWRH